MSEQASTLIMSVKDSLELRMDDGFKNISQRIDALTEQVKKTNGRVTANETYMIKHEVEVKYLKALFAVIIAPIIIYLLTKGIDYFLPWQ